MTDSGAPKQSLLKMSGINKTFPGVKALQSVEIEVFPGECVALMGENGAGKSTLMKILSGVYSPDDGSIEIAGKPATLTNPHQAQQLGVSIIYQEFNLFPNMTVEENVFVGREPSSNGFVRWSSLRSRRWNCSINSVSISTPARQSAISAWPNSRWSKSRRRSPITPAS